MHIDKPIKVIRAIEEEQWPVFIYFSAAPERNVLLFCDVVFAGRGGSSSRQKTASKCLAQLQEHV